MRNYIQSKIILSLTVILLLVVAGGCVSSQVASEGETDQMEEMGHEESDAEGEMDHDSEGHGEDKMDHDGEDKAEGEMDHDGDGHGAEEAGHDEDAMHSDGHSDDGGAESTTHSHAGAERLPNDGATIQITSPADGDTFKVGDEIIVEIEIENFELDNEGSHWHVYIDGTSYGMVMGDNMDEVLRGVEAGEHEITAYLAVGSHEELEEGGSVTIVVEE